LLSGKLLTKSSGAQRRGASTIQHAIQHAIQHNDPAGETDFPSAELVPLLDLAVRYEPIVLWTGAALEFTKHRIPGIACECMGLGTMLRAVHGAAVSAVRYLLIFVRSALDEATLVTYLHTRALRHPWKSRRRCLKFEFHCNRDLRNSLRRGEHQGRLRSRRTAANPSEI
jgi:hypothetical protein